MKARFRGSHHVMFVRDDNAVLYAERVMIHFDRAGSTRMDGVYREEDLGCLAPITHVVPAYYHT